MELYSSDSNYKIYMLPVKLFNNYTIAIDSDQPVEICCGLYNTKLDMATSETEELNKSLLKQTYVYKSSSYFHQPFLYTALSELVPIDLSKDSTIADYRAHQKNRLKVAKLAKNEANLKLFLKVSKHVASTIVILEGDYVKWNDSITKFISNTNTSTGLLNVDQNHLELPVEAIYSDLDFKLISKLQLLERNTKEQIPFSDRLLEYLLDGCVTGGDAEIRENVLMAQALARMRYKGTAAPSTIVNQVDGSVNKYYPTAFRYNSYNGIWSESLRRLFYSNAANKKTDTPLYDTLGYVDKDIEKYFSAIDYTGKDKGQMKTMLNYDAWEDDT
jgi:hypothetical protein